MKKPFFFFLSGGTTGFAGSIFTEAGSFGTLSVDFFPSLLPVLAREVLLVFLSKLEKHRKNLLPLVRVTIPILPAEVLEHVQFRLPFGKGRHEQLVPESSHDHVEHLLELLYLPSLLLDLAEDVFQVPVADPRLRPDEVLQVGDAVAAEFVARENDRVGVAAAAGLAARVAVLHRVQTGKTGLDVDVGSWHVGSDGGVPSFRVFLIVLFLLRLFRFVLCLLFLCLLVLLPAETQTDVLLARFTLSTGGIVRIGALTRAQVFAGDTLNDDLDGAVTLGVEDDGLVAVAFGRNVVRVLRFELARSEGLFERVGQDEAVALVTLGQDLFITATFVTIKHFTGAWRRPNFPQNFRPNDGF